MCARNARFWGISVNLRNWRQLAQGAVRGGESYKVKEPNKEFGTPTVV
jgi:hypothetical protein